MAVGDLGDDLPRGSVQHGARAAQAGITPRAAVKRLGGVRDGARQRTERVRVRDRYQSERASVHDRPPTHQGVDIALGPRPAPRSLQGPCLGRGRPLVAERGGAGGGGAAALDPLRHPFLRFRRGVPEPGGAGRLLHARVLAVPCLAVSERLIRPVEPETHEVLGLGLGLGLRMGLRMGVGVGVGVEVLLGVPKGVGVGRHVLRLRLRLGVGVRVEVSMLRRRMGELRRELRVRRPLWVGQRVEAGRDHGWGARTDAGVRMVLLLGHAQVRGGRVDIVARGRGVGRVVAAHAHGGHAPWVRQGHGQELHMGGGAGPGPSPGPCVCHAAAPACVGPRACSPEGPEGRVGGGEGAGARGAPYLAATAAHPGRDQEGLLGRSGPAASALSPVRLRDGDWWES